MEHLFMTASAVVEVENEGENNEDPHLTDLINGAQWAREKAFLCVSLFEIALFGEQQQSQSGRVPIYQDMHLPQAKGGN